MKKIINGKLYNTETAKVVGEYKSPAGPASFDYFEETLYRKKTGEYFVFGEGHANSKYATHVDYNTWGAGSAFTPLTWEQARAWSEKYLEPDEYEQEFGAIEDDSSRITIALSISAAALEKAKRKASQTGISLSGYIESLIESQE